MSTLSPEQIADVARSAGFKGAGLERAVAVALAESGGRTDVTSPPNRDGSRDRGLWQINSRWHREVSDRDAYNPAAAARAAYRISAHGSNFSPWSTWNNGSAQKQLPRTRQAIGRATLTGGTGGTSSGPTGGLTPNANGVFSIPSPGELWQYGKGPLLNNPDGALLGLGGGLITGPLDSIKAMTAFVVKAYEWISDSHNWMRIALVIGGTAAILLGLKILADSGAAGSTAQAGSAAASATTKTAVKLAAVV